MMYHEASSRKKYGEEYDCCTVDNGPFAMPGCRTFWWVDKRSRRVAQAVLRGRPDQPEYWSYLEGDDGGGE